METRECVLTSYPKNETSFAEMDWVNNSDDYIEIPRGYYTQSEELEFQQSSKACGWN